MFEEPLNHVLRRESAGCLHDSSLLLSLCFLRASENPQVALMGAIVVFRLWLLRYLNPMCHPSELHREPRMIARPRSQH